MIDLSKLTESIGSLISGAQQQSPLQAGNIADLLSNAGIDPSMLDGLSQEEIFSLLQQHGIDPSLLDVSQVGEILQNSNIGGNLADIAQSWLNSRRS